MRLLTVVELFVAAATNVLEGLALLEAVLVGSLLFAPSVVEVHANLIIAHVLLRDTVDVLLSLWGGRFRLPAVIVIRLFSVRISVILRDLLEP